MKKEIKDKKIECRLSEAGFKAFSKNAVALEMTNSEYLRDLINSRNHGIPLSGVTSKKIAGSLCRIQGLYPDDEELNQEVKEIWRYWNL